MPARLPPLTERAVRVLFESIVDYAGLFPPASLPMNFAVRNYAHYRAGGNAWMLGRFICPITALEEFSQRADAFLPRDAGAIPWRLSAISSGDVAADLVAIAAFNARHRVCFDEVAAVVDTYEVRAQSTVDVMRLDAAIPSELVTYVELATVPDPTPLIHAVARSGRRVKLRMGGVTADAFPVSDDVVRFLAVCMAANVPVKATAGLHHPLRGAFRLTYDPHAAQESMFGFVNLFLAAAHLASGGSVESTRELLVEQHMGSIVCSESSISWQDSNGEIHHFDRALLQRIREHTMTSFGSCSFLEPVDESRAMGLL